MDGRTLTINDYLFQYAHNMYLHVYRLSIVYRHAQFVYGLLNIT